nr:hypothetical protein [Mesorhizobium sp.]
MAFFVGVMGVLQVGFGCLMWLASRSAMHETTSATLVGLGIIAIGLAGLLNRADEIRAELVRNGARIDAREAGAVDRHVATERIAAAFDRLGRKPAE